MLMLLFIVALGVVAHGAWRVAVLCASLPSSNADFEGL